MDLRVPMQFRPEVRLEKIEERFIELKSGERHSALYGLAAAAYDAGHKEFDDLHRYLVGIYEKCPGGADYKDCEDTARNICDNYTGEASIVKARPKAVKAPESHMPFWRKWCWMIMDMTKPVESDGSIDTEEKVENTITSSVASLCIDKEAFYFAGTIYNDKSASAFFTPAVGDYNSCLPPSQYICLNPLTDRTRDIEHCKHVDYMLLEMDEPIAESKNDKGTEAWLSDMLDQQCRFWTHVIKAHPDLPVACLTYSGGKSVHAQIAVDATPEELERHREALSRLYAELHFDTANIDPVRKSRIPGGLRSYIVGSDGYMMDEMKEYDFIIKEMKGRNKEKAAMAKAKLDAHGINWYHPNKTCIYQDCLMIRPDVRRISLAELESILQSIVDEFLPKSDNAFEQAKMRHENLPMTQSNFQAYLDFTGKRIYFDDITRRPVYKGFMETDGGNGDCQKSALKEIRDEWMELDGRFPPISETDLCIDTEMERKKVNPVAEWLDDLSWDGNDRLPEVYAILGIQNDNLSKNLTRKWLMQCVALAENTTENAQGADGVLTLLGRQGIGKTSFFRELVPKDHQKDWFKDAVSLDTEKKDDMLELTSGWIKELGEVDSITRKEQSALKGIITAKDDEIRLPYDKRPVRRVRHVSLCATVNKEDYLRDVENRRWWTVPVDRIDLERLNELDVDQLWAQVKSMVDAGKEWRLGADGERLAARNKGNRMDSGWEDTIRYEYDFTAKDGWEWQYLKDLADALAPYPDRDLRQQDKTAIRVSLNAIGVEHRIRDGLHQFRMPPRMDKTVRERLKTDDGPGEKPF